MQLSSAFADDILCSSGEIGIRGRFFKGKYVDAHCVGVDVDGHTAVHWVAVKSIGKSVFYNPTDAAKYAEAMSDYYDKHYAFGGTPIRQTQWEHFLEKD